MNKISIVIPVYNVEQYLPQCLDSILQQSYQEWEAILIDDGSTDLSGCICDEYAKKDIRFVVIHKENGGAASAKNVGLNSVSGDFVAFMDSDDFADVNWLKTAITTAQEYSADVVEFDFDRVYYSRYERVNYFGENASLFSAQSYLEQYVTVWTSSLFWNKIYRSNIVGNIHFREEHRCIDDEFFTYKVLSAANRIVRIPDVLYHYRQRASSAVYSPKNQRQIAEDSLEVLIERYEWVSARFPMLRKTYLRHDIQILFYFAAFSHTNETVQEFRRICRYFLLQVIRYPVDLSMLYAAIRLQFITKKQLLREKNPPGDNKDIGDYFE